MSDSLILRPADQPGDIEHLRAWLAAQHPENIAALDRHLAQPRYHAALTRLAEHAGALAGCALIDHRRLRLGLARLEVGAIDLLTPGDDAGVRAELLGDCVETLMQQGLSIATLDGTRPQDAPFGFAPFRFQASVELRGGAAAPSLRAAGAEDLDDLAALYQAGYAELALAEDRAAPDWRAWLEHHAALALEDARGRVIAYAATAAPAAGLLPVGEAAAADAGAARQLCAALLDRAHAQAQRGLRLSLAPWHPVAQAALHMGGAARLWAPAEAEPAALAGVVDLLGALEALAPELERRLARSRYAGWSGNLRVELPAERLTLAFEQGIATVIDGQRPADLRLRQVELEALAQLCLGYRAAADLRATGGLSCDDAALGLIDALFPTALAVG